MVTIRDYLEGLSKNTQHHRRSYDKAPPKSAPKISLTEKVGLAFQAKARTRAEATGRWELGTVIAAPQAPRRPCGRDALVVGGVAGVGSGRCRTVQRT